MSVMISCSHTFGHIVYYKILCKCFYGPVQLVITLKCSYIEIGMVAAEGHKTTLHYSISPRMSHISISVACVTLIRTTKYDPVY